MSVARAVMDPNDCTPKNDGPVTELLQEWGDGDPAALEKLIPLVFDELRQIASRMFRREKDFHTLQPTALVHEAYLKLLHQKAQWQNREQFFSVAALLMRRILVDYAKGRQTAKRGKDAFRVPLDEAHGVADPRDLDLDLVALDDALSRLAEIDERQSGIVEMRFFIGLSHEEIAEVLGISLSTVKREWKTAKLWLYRELEKQ
jgi:RNA polymerase sigma factor (TIGR02999 family)